MEKVLLVKKNLKLNKLDAFLVSSIANIVYLTGYSGFSLIEREAYLLITKKKQYIFTDARYSTAVKKLVPHFILIERSPSIPVERQFQEIIQKEHITTLGFEEENITVSEYKLLRKYGVKLISEDECIKSLRMYKTESEIAAIQKACSIGDKAFQFILNNIKPGITEIELSITLEFFIKKQGADISFPPIVAFGKNAAIPHHKVTDEKLPLRCLVLLDFGVKYNNYCSDMTRTLFLGKAAPEEKRMYETVRTAQQKAIELVQNHYSSSEVLSRFGLRLTVEDLPKDESRSSSRQSSNSINASEVDKVAREYILSQGYPSIPHSVGHGIGIEVHEDPNLSPKSDFTLNSGMVFSIEPGIYVPNEYGVRIEDLVTIQGKKIIELTKNPKNLIEL